MAPIVALLGHNGTVGSNLLPYLINAHTKGSLKLVILYRPSSDLSKIPSDEGIEKRVIELKDGETENIRVTVKDLEFKTIYLVEALQGSSALKAFIPSDFGVPWDKQEIEIPGLEAPKAKERVAEKAKELKVPITEIKVGLFDLFFFGYKVLGVDVKSNKVQYFHQSLKNPLHLTSLAYLGHAVTELVTDIHQLAQLPGTTPNIYDFVSTGQEIVDVLTKIHDKPTEQIEVSDKDNEEQLQGSRAIGAAIFKKWGDNNWGDIPKTEVDGWIGKEFADVVKEWADKT
ncbi:hypothetical protein I305_06046 [Cryptococcus gattii E566]|uniref:NmrA-like domain-containing protein n=1 Tax=Cryptococcus gattii EJB2 TaxID=1296103 RepID=A0ABR5BN41_9TREE|nr:hypothetical protein I306_06010 [Cryptococcus gattii EJB2]KIY31574.1 hypothetical protein I305_06046 [Cryptococcus gattii E566]